MTIKLSAPKLYEEFGLAYFDIFQFSISTTRELTLPQNKVLFKKEIRRLKEKASLEGRNLSFDEIKRLNYITHKRAEKTKPDGTPYRTGTQTYGHSQKESIGNDPHRRAGKNISDF